jgi:putative glycerol-1-phosphate prenyltransferase
VQQLFNIQEKLSGSKQIAVLIDPETYASRQVDLLSLCQKLNGSPLDFIFIGGSTVSTEDFDICASLLKEHCKLPLVIFPGSPNQISKKADGILLLSLISGRNPDYLIGHHVHAAPVLDKMDIEILPTGYILVDGGNLSSVAYVSQTTPIPQDKVSIVVNTALAGTQIGLKNLFIDAGSGAQKSVAPQLISAVKSKCGVPLIVGGGFKSRQDIELAFVAGANVVVVGNKIEDDMDFLLDLISLKLETKV